MYERVGIGAATKSDGHSLNVGDDAHSSRQVHVHFAFALRVSTDCVASASSLP
jgi:hypothetical protein